MDILNHSVHAKAEWDFKPRQSFSLNLLDGEAYVTGQELFNNYAPKQNDELLLGYGFCLGDNPIEQFPLKLVSPVPEEYARQLGFLDAQNVPYGMNPDFLKADQTNEQQFLRPKGHPFGRYENVVPFFRGIPPFIIHSFFVQAMLTLDVDLSSIDVRRPGARLTIQVLALLHHAISMRCSTLPLSSNLTPQNDKQCYAQIYRNGQAKLIYSIRHELSTALTKLRISSPVNTAPSHPMLLSVEQALTNLTHRQVQHFQSGMQKHNLASPKDDTILWTLLVIVSLAHELSSSNNSSSSSSSTTTAPYLTPSFLAAHPLPTIEDGITDAETYSFIDENIVDFLNLGSSDASPVDFLDDLGLTFVNQPQGSQENVFVQGKTENLGVRLIMWAMNVVEREIVPVWDVGRGKMEMYLFCVRSEDGEGWMYEEVE